MDIYCTLFDSNYLTRGLAMYQSLKDTGESFKLFIFAFDDLAYDVLNRMLLPEVEIVSLQDFESDLLLSLKKERTRAEYCWTCTSFSILYVLENYDVPEVTYLDADLFFFDKPSILLNEFHATSCDVLITKHRYSPQYSHHEFASGTYCVQFMTFKNNANGLYILKWWRDRCIECCTSKPQDGKFGDQKYLDDWPERFRGVHVLNHLGGGVAPWNVQQYCIEHGPKVNGANVIFYHFHNLKIFDDETYKLVSGYFLPQNVIELLYLPYIRAIEDATHYVCNKIGSCYKAGKVSIINDNNYYGKVMNSLIRYGIEKIKEASCLLIYGAGDVAKDVISILASIDINKFNVVVSELREEKYLMGNKVSPIDNFIDYKNKAVVIISVGVNLQQELCRNAKKLGFENIVSLN